MKINDIYNSYTRQVRSSQEVTIPQNSVENVQLQLKEQQDKPATEVKISQKAKSYAKALEQFNESEQFRDTLVTESKNEVKNWQSLSNSAINAIAEGIMNEF